MVDIEATKKNIISRLNSINNIAIILATIYKPIEEVMKERNCTKDEAIIHKETADNYVRQYGILTIQTQVKDIKELVNGIDSVYKEENK